VQGYIIEGVVGTGKTTLMRAVEAALADRYPASTRLILSEHYTDRLFEDDRRDGAATFADGLAHCEELARRIVWLADVKYSSKFADVGGRASVHVIIERFAATHVAHHVVDRVLGEEESNRIESLFRSLAEVGIVSVVLEAAPEVLEESIAETRKQRPESWSNYLNFIGSDDEIVDFFVSWQERLVGFYDDHDLPSEHIAIQSIDEAREMTRVAESLVTRWDD